LLCRHHWRRLSTQHISCLSRHRFSPPGATPF
jgi:hypothetical protein